MNPKPNKKIVLRSRVLRNNCLEGLFHTVPSSFVLHCSLKQQKVFSLYFQTFLALSTIGDNRVRHPTLNWAFLHFTDFKGENKHPNVEWRGQGSGVDSFVLWSYPIWAQCLNSFVTDCNQNCPSENTTYVNTKKQKFYHRIQTTSQNPPPPSQHLDHGFLNKWQILSLFSFPPDKSNDIILIPL